MKWKRIEAGVYELRDGITLVALVERSPSRSWLWWWWVPGSERTGIRRSILKAKADAEAAADGGAP